MVELVQDIIELLEKYFIYIYPGFISVFVFHFSKARGTKINKSTFLTCVVISYIYIIFYRVLFKRSVNDFKDYDYIALFVTAILIPVIWHWISRTKWLEDILLKLGFNTSIEDNVWDYLQYRDKKKEGIILKVFLDNQELMYEGSLRYRESDPDKEKNICLSGYRRYVKEDGKYKIVQDYNNDNSRWVLINIEDITRSEILYKDAK